MSLLSLVTALALAALTMCAAELPLHQMVGNHITESLKSMEREGASVSRGLRSAVRMKLASANAGAFSKATVRPFIGRHFLEDEETPSFCEWEDDVGDCTLSDATVVDFLSERDNFILQSPLICTVWESRQACEARDGCIWSSDFCEPKNDQVQRILQQCFAGLGALLPTIIGDVCSEVFETEVECNEAPNCVWDDDFSECGVDIQFILTGISTEDFSTAVDEVLQAIVDQLGSQVEQLISSGAPPEDILDFAFDTVECPESINPRLCALIDPLMEVARLLYFCPAKHGDDVDGCTSDERCDVDGGTTCIVAPSVIFQATIEAIQSLIEDPDLSQFFRDTTSCRLAESEPDCTDLCAWDEEEGVCNIRGQEVLQRAAASSPEETREECEFTVALIASDCLFIENEDECTAASCVWDVEDGCGPRENFIIDAIFANDPDSAQEIKAAEEKCNVADNKDTCLEITP